MIVEKLKHELAERQGPATSVLSKGAGYKVMLVAFKKGMVLKSHTSPVPAKLLVLEGEVVYTQGESRLMLGLLQDTAIPPGVLHSVECTQDAICLVVQG